MSARPGPVVRCMISNKENVVSRPWRDRSSQLMQNEGPLMDCPRAYRCTKHKASSFQRSVS